MKVKSRYFFYLLATLIIIYVGACVYYFINQEKMIFAPVPLSENHRFEFDVPFEEVFLTTLDNFQLHALHFKTENPKGVIYYLHGKSGNLDSWGWKAKTFLKLGYDVFLIDYRGFGKSESKIKSEKQFYEDAQLGYDYLKNIYPESQITIIGFSLGSGAATFLAKEKNPKELILLAPYFQIDEKFKQDKFYLPKFLCQYEFPIDEMIEQVQVPIKIFYGESDEISKKEEIISLEKQLKPSDKLIELKQQGHNNIEENEVFLKYFQF